VGPLRAERRRPVPADRATTSITPAAWRSSGRTTRSRTSTISAARSCRSRPSLSASSSSGSRVGGRLPLAMWGLRRRPRDVRLRGAPLRPPHGRSTRRSSCRRCRSTSCRRGRCSATCARCRAWRWRSAASPSRRSIATTKGPTGFVARLPWLVMAALGLFVGYESRGGLLGLGRSAARRRPRRGRCGARSAHASGPVRATWWERSRSSRGSASQGWRRAPSPRRATARTSTCGSGRRCTSRRSTRRSTTTSAHIGHALAPWSAFAPFAFGRLYLAPDGAHGARASARAWRAWRCSSALGGGARRPRLPGARTDLIAFTARRSAPSPAPSPSATSSAARTRRSPWAWGRCSSRRPPPRLPRAAREGVPGLRRHGATFPESFKDEALNLWWVVLGGFALTAFLTWVERDAERTPFDPATYAQGLRALREAYDGLLALGLLRDHRGRVAGGPVRHSRA
jgi:hypothetical protein